MLSWNIRNHLFLVSTTTHDRPAQSVLDKSRPWVEGGFFIQEMVRKVVKTNDDFHHYNFEIWNHENVANLRNTKDLP